MNFLTIDTETSVRGKDLPCQSVFDIGWTIANQKGETLVKRSYLVKEFSHSCITMRKGFLLDSGQVEQGIYLRKIANGSMKIAGWSAIMGQLKKDSKKYSVEYIGAYNLGFDMRVISKTNFYFTEKDFDFFDNFFLIDLYNVACSTVLNNPEYKEFAKKNGFVSEKGNFLTKAETTYKYLFDEIEYVEEHTALSDCEDEQKILFAILNSPETIPLKAYRINPMAWRIVNEENLNKKKS